jgi:hypothetical protein
MRNALIIFGLLVLAAIALRLSLGSVDTGWENGAPAVLLSSAQVSGDLEDDRWQAASETVLDGYEGSFWFRSFVQLRRSDLRLVHVSGTASYDVWWDGQFLGRNGQLADDGTELEVGRMDAIFTLPGALAYPGTHTLVMRVNRDGLHGSPLSGAFDLLSPSDYPLKLMSQPAIALLAALFALGSAGVYLILSFRHPSRVQAIYIAFCLSFFLLSLMEAWRNVLGYDYPWQLFRLQAIALLTAVTGLLLNVFLVTYFNIRRMIWIMPVLALILIGTYAAMPGRYDDFGALAALLFVCTAIIFCALAVHRGRTGAPLLLSCLSGALVLNLFNLSYVDEWGIFAIFLLFTSAVNYALARDARKIERSLVETQVRSLRLRQELYRRFIQPHFLLNTLTTISEWIVQAPERAEEAIGELAGEVRVLGRMIDKDLVPIGDEIGLCERHCKVMSRRLQTIFRLQTKGLCSGTIPPAVLHTLVENVFAHNRYTASEIVLELECATRQNQRILRLIAPCGDAARSKPNDGPGGLQYVRARLAEAYDNAWQLTVREQENHWVAELKIPAVDA